jgi:hypothetical protein
LLRQPKTRTHFSFFLSIITLSHWGRSSFPFIFLWEPFFRWFAWEAFFLWFRSFLASWYKCCWS